MRLTKMNLLKIAAVFLVAASILMVLFFANLENRLGSNAIRVACVGDSITKGCGYPEELQIKLGDAYNVENFGVGGATVMAESGKPYINQIAFQNAKQFLPDIIVIMLGTNDASLTNQPSIEDFTDEYKTLISEFQEITSKPRIFLAKPPPIFNNTLGLSNITLVEDIIPCVEKAANELGLPLIDIYSALITHPEYFSEDGVHPTLKGAQAIAEEVSEAITLTNAAAAFVPQAVLVKPSRQ
jgi:acyl-CoA thioesterase-1